jgi:pSer/pThr/pTyr-binding forkhead associated (FHA) protein
MSPDQHVNPAEEPSPSRPKKPAANDATFMPGVLREPTSRVRIQSRVIRIGRHPDNDIIVSDPRVSAHHAELRRAPAGRYSITDLGSRNGTYVNGTRVNQQEITEDDIIAIGHAVTVRLSAGQLIEYIDDGSSPG